MKPTGKMKTWIYLFCGLFCFYMAIFVYSFAFDYGVKHDLPAYIFLPGGLTGLVGFIGGVIYCIIKILND